MIKVGFKFTGDWRKLQWTLDPVRFQAAIDGNMRRATMLNGMIVVAEIKRRIKARRYAANSPLSVLMKRSSKPLVDDGDLFNSVTSVPVTSTHVFVGILRKTRDASGTPLVNIAQLLHEGGTIPVTNAMRGLFALLADYAAKRIDKSALQGRALELANELGSRVKQIRPFKASTRTLLIPRRPFLIEVFRDPSVLKKIKKNWERAMQQAVEGKGPGGGGAPPAGPPSKAQAARAVRGARVPKAKKGPADRSAAARKGWQTRRSKLAPP